MVEFDTIQLETARVLRRNLDLRSINHRELVWRLVQSKVPHAKFSTVERCIRKLQNTMSMYQPEHDDKRFDKEREYREYFRE